MFSNEEIKAKKLARRFSNFVKMSKKEFLEAGYTDDEFQEYKNNVRESQEYLADYTMWLRENCNLEERDFLMKRRKWEKL